MFSVIVAVYALATLFLFYNVFVYGTRKNMPILHKKVGSTPVWLLDGITRCILVTLAFFGGIYLAGFVCLVTGWTDPTDRTVLLFSFYTTTLCANATAIIYGKYKGLVYQSWTNWDLFTEFAIVLGYVFVWVMSGYLRQGL